MDKPSLSAPWRIEYIRTLDKPDGGACFLCDAVAATAEADKRTRLVLWASDHSIVLINRFPYTNGHLLIAPRAHKAEFEQLNDAEHLDLQTQTAHAIKLLKRAISAQGFNIGINIGRCAGAGLPGHVHQHLVPRWAGDTNFISVVGEVRVVPQAMSQLYEELVRCNAEL
jgi:ATP adenylyltransferase